MTGILDGRVALVTGASRGIGAAAAKALAAEGAHVILIARTEGGLAETGDAILASGGQATLIPLDLAAPGGIEQLAPAIAERFHRLDILVGNAATLGSLSPVAHSDAAMWENVFSLNLLANVRLIRAFDPFLRGSDAGRAIFVTSGIADQTRPFWSAYAASKTALETIVKTYAAEVAHSPLKVNIIDPGVVRTSLRAEAFPGEDPLTLPAPDSIAHRFVELASPSCENSGHILKAA